MARLIHGTASSAPTTRHADPLTDLNRLLQRLQQTILHADAEREARLRANEFEREKARHNIRYAQSLLTKLEQEALAVKINARRQELQSDLNRKRETLEQVADRISDLAEIADSIHDDDPDGGGGDTSEEDILAELIIATPSESLDNSSRSPDDDDEDDVAAAVAAAEVAGPDPISDVDMPEVTTTPAPRRPSLPLPLSEKRPEEADTTATSQTLRPRRPEASTEKAGISTGSSVAATSALFGDRSNKGLTTAAMATATEEAILDHQRAEQDLLSESILRLATDLKSSSHAFSASLEEDKEVVDRAGQGMSKTGEGMEAVTRRMGMLQRMTEGEGWWGRMRLYAQVYGLMVALVLVVFVLPKLRF